MVIGKTISKWYYYTQNLTRASCEKGYVASISLLKPYHNLFQKAIPSFIMKAFLTLSVGLVAGTELNTKWW